MESASRERERERERERDMVYRKEKATPTKVQAGDGVGALPLGLVRGNSPVLPEYRDPPAKREKPVFDDVGGVETAGKGGGALRRDAVPLHVVWGTKK